jgi:LysM repeat protein
MRKVVQAVLVVGMGLLLSSCAAVAPRPPLAGPPANLVVGPGPVVPVLRHNIYHEASPGDTLWRISKMYDVPLKEVMRANSLHDAAALKMGQRLLIPMAAPIKPVVPLYRSRPWKYIIIHHSATDDGNALSFYRSHRSRGWDSLGYHFVVDNGSDGKQDGQIEVSPRWTKQQDGAHCRASGMNSIGIGICLVGNFSKDRPSRAQLESLAYLVKVLQKQYRIPERNIIGHGRVPLARTECPGKMFPWAEFQRLKERN